MKHLISINITFVILMFSMTIQAEDLNDISLPLFDVMSGMQTEWVAKKMIYNGHPMSIQNFKANRNTKDVMRHYQSKWKVKGFGQLKYQHVGNNLTLGYEHRGYSYSVQSHDIPGGSVGSLVVTRDKVFKEPELSFPVQKNVHVVSRSHNLDLGVHSETITLSSFRSASMNKEWYLSELLRNGWKKQDSLSGQKNRVLEFQKGKELCQLTFVNKSPVREHRSMILIHWIKG